MISMHATKTANEKFLKKKNITILTFNKCSQASKVVIILKKYLKS